MSQIKNIAIIAHVDHGKTTLVDKIMFHCQLFRENENKGDLILDNNELERERGITITSKNVSVISNPSIINSSSCFLISPVDTTITSFFPFLVIRLLTII